MTKLSLQVLVSNIAAWQKLVAELSEPIRGGVFNLGDKLPTESAIMDVHGVSRTMVREALLRLRASGLVETRHGIGPFVLNTPIQVDVRLRLLDL